MTFFTLPRLPPTGDPVALISPVFGDTEDAGKCAISQSLWHYLVVAKTRIESHALAWDRHKRFTNPYEYVHTAVPGQRYAVCRLRPVSRAFYKMLEIWKLSRLAEALPEGPFLSVHLAEGPGGFIEALAHVRKRMPDTYVGITLSQGDDPSIPGWRGNALLAANDRRLVIDECGGSGDILKRETLEHCISEYAGRASLVTGDGGFDFSSNFSHQETLTLPLILAQAAHALVTQAKGGCFVVKLFDVFTQATIDLVYLLGTAYKMVQIVKPHTSRHANSERYAVCKDFRLPPKAALDMGRRLFSVATAPEAVCSLIERGIPRVFTSRLEESNAIFGQQQLENIVATLTLIDEPRAERLESLKRANVQRCITWCSKHDVPCQRMGPRNSSRTPTEHKVRDV